MPESIIIDEHDEYKIKEILKKRMQKVSCDIK